MNKAMVTLCLIACLGTTSFAQIRAPFLNTSKDFLESEFCRVLDCVPAGTLLLSDGDTEHYFLVSGFKNPAFGADRYMVFLTKCVAGSCMNQWTRAGIRYQPVQDDPEDGAFALEFLSFITGIPFQAYPADELLSNCTKYLRGNDGVFTLLQSDLSAGGAGEPILYVVPAYPFASNMFEKLSPTARVATLDDCQNSGPFSTY